MASPSLKRAGNGAHDGGVHFTWLLSTEREDDLDLVSEGDEDDAMLQLDEEYMSEMEKKAAERDNERDSDNDSDFDLLEAEDRRARAEYDAGATLVSPRRRNSVTIDGRSVESPHPTRPTCFQRTMHHVPCTTCCFPIDGSQRKDCDSQRVLKKTQRFCMPNFELLRTLRIVKHVRIFRKILDGTSKASYYGEPKSHAGDARRGNSSDVDIGLSEFETNTDSESSSRLQSSNGTRSESSRYESSNAMEMDEYEVNEITGERIKRNSGITAGSSSLQEPSVELDLESGINTPPGASIRDEIRGSEIDSLRKPSWALRKKAALRRVKELAKETVSNINPGLLTAVVNFPLVLAVAGGVGAHPYFGLNAAFWSAMAATFFAGSRYTIAAPTMLLTSNLVSTVSTYGTYVLPVISLLAAMMIYIMIFTRAIELVTFVPSMVTHGVTLGTTALVIIYQLKFALGLAGNMHASSVPYYILEMIQLAFTSTNWRAVLMFSVAMCISYGILRWGRGFPFAYVLVPLGILVGWILDRTVQNQSRTEPYIETIGTRYGHVEFHPFVLTHWQKALFNWEVLGKAMEVAFICVMESYSTSQMTYEITGKRFSKNHEMFSLATSNFVSGVFGGMPSSVGVTRTLLNIRSGATSRAAGLVNGLLLLLFSLTLTNWLRYFPLPVVAALQIVAAWRSVDVAVWTKAWNEARLSTSTSLLTALLCVIVNPFIGLLLGIIISMSIFSRQLSKGHSELTVKTKVQKVQIVREPSSGLSGSSASLYDAQTRPNPLLRSSTNSAPPSNSKPAPRLAQQRFNLGASLTDLPASRTISIRNAVAQLQPILHDSIAEDDEASEVRYNVVVYRISGVMTFINAHTHFETLKSIISNKGVTCLILNLRFLYYVDYDGKIVLCNLMNYVDAKLKIPTYLVGVTTDLAKRIKKDSWYKKKKRDNLIWKLESDAFKDIQRRNAKLIEQEQANTLERTASNVSIERSPSIAAESSSSFSNASDSSTSPISPNFGASAMDGHVSEASELSGSKNTPFTLAASPLSSPPPLSNSAPDYSIPLSNSNPRPIPRLSTEVKRGSSGSLISVSSPGPDSELTGATMSHRSGKKRLATRRAVVGSTSPGNFSSLSGAQSTSYTSAHQSPLFTAEEMEMAIAEAAVANGLDPISAVASASAFLRAHRAQKDVGRRGLKREGSYGSETSDAEAKPHLGDGRVLSHAASTSSLPRPFHAIHRSSSDPSRDTAQDPAGKGQTDGPSSVSPIFDPYLGEPRAGRTHSSPSFDASTMGALHGASKKAGSARGSLTRSGLISAPIQTEDRQAAGRRAKKSRIVVSRTADPNSVSPGVYTSDIPHGLSRFHHGSYSSQYDEPSHHSLDQSSGAEFDAEDEHSDDSGHSSSSSDDEHLGHPTYFHDFMSPVEDDGPLYQRTQANSGDSTAHPLHSPLHLRLAPLMSAKHVASATKRTAYIRDPPSAPSTSASSITSSPANSQSGSLTDLPPIIITGAVDHFTPPDEPKPPTM